MREVSHTPCFAANGLLHVRFLAECALSTWCTSAVPNGTHTYARDGPHGARPKVTFLSKLATRRRQST
eukprot:4918532-Prymnesium_polylepis.1